MKKLLNLFVLSLACVLASCGTGVKQGSPEDVVYSAIKNAESGNVENIVKCYGDYNGDAVSEDREKELIEFWDNIYNDPEVGDAYKKKLKEINFKIDNVRMKPGGCGALVDIKGNPIEGYWRPGPAEGLFEACKGKDGKWRVTGYPGIYFDI